MRALSAFGVALLSLLTGIAGTALWMMAVSAAQEHGLIHLNVICSGPDYLAFLASIPVVFIVSTWLTFHFAGRRIRARHRMSGQTKDSP